MTAVRPAGPVNRHPMPDVLTVECGVTDLAPLIRAAQAGDRRDFELYAAYARTVHGIVCRACLEPMSTISCRTCS